MHLTSPHLFFFYSLFLSWVSARGRHETGGKGVGMLSEGEEKVTSMSRAEVSSKGKGTVREKYGEDYFQRIGKKGGTVLKEKRGREYYRAIAQKGGRANVSKYGSDHFSAMGKKGGNTTKERQDADFYSRIGRLGGAAKRRNKVIGIEA